MTVLGVPFLGNPWPMPLTLARTSFAVAAVLLILTSQEPASASDWWNRPISGEVIQEFHPPERTFGSGHRGVDLAATPGAPIFAMHSGTVLFAGRIAGIPIISLSTNTGELRSTYQPADPLVTAGETVEQGQAIGHVANRRIDHCSDHCLHVGVRTDSQYFNPRIFWGGLLVLKPR